MFPVISLLFNEVFPSLTSMPQTPFPEISHSEIVAGEEVRTIPAFVLLENVEEVIVTSPQLEASNPEYSELSTTEESIFTTLVLSNKIPVSDEALIVDEFIESSEPPLQ